MAKINLYAPKEKTRHSKNTCLQIHELSGCGISRDTPPLHNYNNDCIVDYQYTVVVPPGHGASAGTAQGYSHPIKRG